MDIVSLATRAAERLPLPDSVTRLGIDYLVARTRRGLEEGSAMNEAAFVRGMAGRPIAESVAAANDQHYELPAAFFRLVLGPRLKYSSCLYPTPGATLAEAEDTALEETCAHADLADGQNILELGCGWGALSLWMARRYPTSRVTAVSNSASQRLTIEQEASRRGLANLTAITADMNVFDTPERFDRIVSVEMFEHMANWRALLIGVARWLAPDGRALVHVFTHRARSYRFESADADDWIGRHFFTGGLMPGQGLIRQFPDLMEVEAEWRWSGEHYRRTALDWLANFDRNSEPVAAVMSGVYGAQAPLWMRRWRLFFLATAGLFGDAAGTEWGVSHYRLRPTSGA